MAEIFKDRNTTNVDAIMHHLMTQEQEITQKQILELTVANNAQMGVGSFGFMMNGVPYVHKSMTHLRRNTKDRLPPLSLMLDQEMVEAFRKRQTNLKLHMQRIRQVLINQLIDRQTFQELRDCLPESLVALVPELKDIPRSVPLSSTYTSDVQARQMEEIGQLIDMYAMMRLLR